MRFVFIFFCVLGSFTAMSSPYNFTSEHDLSTTYTNQISQFWQTGEFSNLNSFDNTRIEYALFFKPQNQHCVVISPGRIEGYLKYKELAYNLSENGYNVAIIDHRGQGLSERLQDNPHKGYVADFDDYAIDLNVFISKIVEPQCDQNVYLLGHSMGGAIAIRYLQTFPNPITASALTSPMIGIDTGAMPMWLGKALINTSLALNSLVSEQAWYFLGHKDYTNKPFAINELTHSKIRYKIFRNEYQQHPEIQLGGVTFNWLAQAVKAEKHMFEDIEQFNTPTLVLQAGNDTIVSNTHQNDFCRLLAKQNNKGCVGKKPVVISGAKHEILFEQDSLRNQALSKILDWFGKQ